MSISLAERKQIVRRVMAEVFGGGRLQTIEELYAPPLRARVSEAVGNIRTAFPDLRIEIEHLLGEDEKIACRWRVQATHTDWFYNLPPTGSTVGWTGTSIYVIDDDGQIVAVTSNWDIFDLLQQIRAALR